MTHKVDTYSKPVLHILYMFFHKLDLGYNTKIYQTLRIHSYIKIFHSFILNNTTQGEWKATQRMIPAKLSYNSEEIKISVWSSMFAAITVIEKIRC